MLSVKAIIKTLLMGSAGIFSLLTQYPVVFIAGVQEIIEREDVMTRITKNNLVFFIFE
jgi:hypothetical protein